MKIRDITLDDVRAGKNWRVLNPKALLVDGFLMEDLEIEPLGRYTSSDHLVYSGIRVFLKDLGEPRSDLFHRLSGRGRSRLECIFAPDDPKELVPEMRPVVEALLMVKEVAESGWDYCERAGGRWRQLGLKPNPDAPLHEEYFANPVNEDWHFNAVGDQGPIRDRHKKGFLNWVRFLNE